MKFSPVVSIIGTLLVAGGCAEPRYGSTTPQVISSPPNETTSYGAAYEKAETDRALENQVRQALANSNLSYLAPRVNVVASNGIVTLSGSVPNAGVRQTLESLARSTSGVNNVINQTRVASAVADTSQSSAPIYSGTATDQTNGPEIDRNLTDRLQQALKNDAATAPLTQNINVSSQNGVVTLTGSVPSEQQRQLVDNVVKNISGVKSVYDQMQLAGPATGRATQESRSYPSAADTPRQPVPAAAGSMTAGDIFSLRVQGLNETDRNLAQQILQGLKNDSTLASMWPSVNINIAGGRVVLQGNVQTQQQKQVIGSVVERAAGGNNVVNQLQVNGQ